MPYSTHLESCLAKSLQILDSLKDFSLILSLESRRCVLMQSKTLVVAPLAKAQYAGLGTKIVV